jgi:hypothetical protein
VPGAKTGRDTASSTQSYLALQTQQNAMLWNTPGAPPQSAMNPSSTDAVLKQKVNNTLRARCELLNRFYIIRYRRKRLVK